MSDAREMRKLFEPAPEAARRRRWTPAAVLVLGALSITMLLWIQRISEQRTLRDLAIVRTIHELQVAVAYWHLWLEEYLTDDPTVDLNRDVRRQQNHARRLVDNLLRGGKSTRGEVVIPLEAPEFIRQAEELEADLHEFHELSEERVRRPREEAGVGTPLDQAFDRKFFQVKSHSDALRRLIAEQLERNRADFRFRVGLTVAAWMSIVMLAAAGLWRLEKRGRAAEDALRTSQRWLATTLSSIGDAVVTTDLQGRIFFMNPMAEQLTGWPREEASGRPIEDVFLIMREDDHQRAENSVAKVLRSGRVVGTTDHTVLLDRRHEMCYSIDEGAAPIRDGSGELLGVVLVFRDASKRRQTEKALHQREAELQQAQKMEAVGRLAGGIAHDVNNYLGAIRGYCEVAMIKGESGEALTRRMNAAIQTADKVSALIRQLLAFSRRQPVQPEVIDLNRLITDLKRLMERLLGEDIALTTRLDPELRAIEIDASQIEQTLVNLMVNARDAMPQGGGISVETSNAELDESVREQHPSASAGSYVKLEVSDTGCGIPPEVREKIFDPFFTTKGESGASGLGLATVYAIVQQYGGFISLESEVGEGTTFEIHLPASAAVATPRAVPRAGRVERARPARVLLVEDNDDMRASTRALLETLGHEVRVAADGEQALGLLADAADASFDLLITDVIMPGLSGKELHQRLGERQGEVRCLFISGYTDDIMLRHGVREDRVHFLQKPFSLEDLARKVGEVLATPGETPAAK